VKDKDKDWLDNVGIFTRAVDPPAPVISDEVKAWRKIQEAAWVKQERRKTPSSTPRLRRKGERRTKDINTRTAGLKGRRR
jgi:hypothetical protein